MPDLFILSFSAGKQNKALRAGQLRGTGGTDAHLHLPLLRAQRELRRFWKGFLCSCAPQGRQKIPISPSGGDLCELLSVEPNPAARLGRICWSLGSPDSVFVGYQNDLTGLASFLGCSCPNGLGFVLRRGWFAGQDVSGRFCA